MQMRHEGVSHWFLVRRTASDSEMMDKDLVIIDPSVEQFKQKPNYSKARGRGFLTKQPSKRARELITRMCNSSSD